MSAMCQKQTSADVLYSINVRTGTETTLGDPHAVEILLAPNGVERVCTITVLMTADILDGDLSII